ncbi:hypothetical protein A2U01_0077129, partial [Trifolium medium]|nr:hypothetical protein [Trifolium medium]
DSLEGDEVEMVEDSFKGVEVEDLEDEVQFNNIEDHLFQLFDLNKIPSDVDENDSYEEKEMRQLKMDLCRIYLNKFY